MHCRCFMCPYLWALQNQLKVHKLAASKPIEDSTWSKPFEAQRSVFLSMAPQRVGKWRTWGGWDLFSQRKLCKENHVSTRGGYHPSSDIYIYIYIHTYIHEYTHIYIYVYIYMLLCSISGCFLFLKGSKMLPFFASLSTSLKPKNRVFRR